MRQKIERPSGFRSIVLALIAGWDRVPACVAQAHGSSGRPTQAQYTLVKMGEDSSGAAVVEQGTILVVKKGGILGVPYSDQSILSTKYEDGAVHSPNASGVKGLWLTSWAKSGKTQTTQFFQVNNKVYPSKIAVNLPKDQVVISIVDCDSCNNVDPKTFYKADVVFQFAKGTLATTNASHVEDAIAGLLALDDSANSNDQGNNQGNNNGTWRKWQ